jgi:BioD-like phosphotransacetylase family protein
MSNIISLRGEITQSRLEPNNDVIELLYMLLENARMGKLRGVAVVTMSDRDLLGTQWAGDADNRLLLSGAVSLNYRLAKHLNDAEI